jgi:hypothetical protein
MNIQFPSTAFVAAGFMAVTACAQAENQTWECSITREGTAHHLTIQLKGVNVVGFDYLTTTQSEAGTNSCSVTTRDYKGLPKVSENMTTFPLLNKDAAVVTKNGNTILLDLSNTDVSNYCGQSATIAGKLAIRRGSRRCLSVVNQ